MLPGKPRLRTLLVSFTTGCIVLSSALLLASFSVLQERNIEKSLLEDNLAYARKLADSVDRHLTTAQREVKWSAEHLCEMKEPTSLRRDIDRLHLSTGIFNAVAVVSPDRQVVYATPVAMNPNVRITSANSLDAIVLQIPLISDPFVTSSGNYAIVISHPIFTQKNTYAGYIGGTIYLKKQSLLSDILSQHYYDRNTEVSVIGKHGEIIYSSKKAKIGYSLDLSDEVKTMLSEETSGNFHNSINGIDYLSGYARLKTTGWNIFVTTSQERVNTILMKTIGEAFWIMLSIIIMMSTLAAYISGRISAPLEKLAQATRSTEPTETLAVLPVINTWYAEAVELREAVSQHVMMMFRKVSNLNEQAMTDPLTGLLNRRGFYKMAVDGYRGQRRSVIAIDIDFFKKINDTYGHHAGDAVLVTLAGLIKDICQSYEVISRFGGEEFVILSSAASVKPPFILAEKIRKAVENTRFPLAGDITISTGIAFDAELETLLKRADDALYKSKRNGRNRTTVWQSENN